MSLNDQANLTISRPLAIILLRWELSHCTCSDDFTISRFRECRLKFSYVPTLVAIVGRITNEREWDYTLCEIATILLDIM